MSSSRGYGSSDRGRDRDHYGRRDSRDSTRRPNTKCRNFNPNTGNRIRPCTRDCVFTHPSDPEWNTAREYVPPNRMGPPPAPHRDRDRDRDRDHRSREPPRESRHERSNSRGDGGPGWSTSPHNPTPSHDNAKSLWSTGAAARSTAGGWDPVEEDVSQGGWGPVEEQSPQAGRDTTDGWGIPGAGKPESLPEKPPPPSLAPLATPGNGLPGKPDLVNPGDPGNLPERPITAPRQDTKGKGVFDISKELYKSAWFSNTPSTTKDVGTRPIEGGTVESAVKSAPVQRDPRIREGKTGTSVKEANPHPPTQTSSIPSQNPSVNPQNSAPQHAPISPADTRFSFATPSRRPSVDTMMDDASRTRKVEKALDLTAQTQDQAAAGPGVSIAPPSVKPTLRISLPSSVAGQTLSLLLQSPMASSLSSSSNQALGSSKSPAQLAWNNNVEVLSQAVNAKMDRLQLANAFDARQRLISRIAKKLSRTNLGLAPDVTEDNAVRDADQQVQTAMATLIQSGTEEKHWWPTPRGGVDYTKAVSSLEKDVETLRLQVGAQNRTLNEMDVDIQDPAQIKKLQDARNLVALEVKNVLDDMEERLASRELDVWLEDQKQKLQEYVSNTIESRYPENMDSGDQERAKAEDLRERLEKLEAKMTSHHTGLLRRRNLDIQRTRDMKALKLRYQELQRKEKDVLMKRQKLTQSANEYLAEVQAQPILADQVLERTTNAVAKERMIRNMVPKLLQIAEMYRSEDVVWAAERYATATNELEAWRATGDNARKIGGETFLRELKDHQAIKAVDICGEKIDQRWDELTSVQRATHKPPAIRFPEGSGSRMS